MPNVTMCGTSAACTPLETGRTTLAALDRVDSRVLRRVTALDRRGTCCNFMDPGWSINDARCDHPRKSAIRLIRRIRDVGRPRADVPNRRWDARPSAPGSSPAMAYRRAGQERTPGGDR